MTIAQNQKMLQLNHRVEALEFSVLSIIKKLADENSSGLGERVLKLEGEIRAMKARMGKIREEA